jgi:PleD family two-component response regulator
VVVCTDAGPDAGEAIVERIVRSLDAPISFAGGSWPPAASIGTARPEPGEGIASIMERADRAMFEAKRERRLGLSRPA